MDTLDDRQKHCPQQSTDVMLHHQFVANFEQQNPTQQWNDIQVCDQVKMCSNVDIR